MAQSATRTRPRRGDDVELAIDSLAHGGAGVGRADGFVVFVRGAVPGDRVRAEIGKSKKSFAEARVVELLEPSPDRVEPVARASRRARGRCCPTSASWPRRSARCATRWSAWAASRRRRSRRSCPAVEPLRYRNKVEYSFGEDEDGELVLGFHRPGRWDVVDPVETDILASERVDERARGGGGLVPRGGPVGLRPRRPHRPAAQPRGARGPAHGHRAGPDRDQPGRLPHRRVRGGAARRRRAVDPDRGRGRDHARRRRPRS